MHAGAVAWDGIAAESVCGITPQEEGDVTYGRVNLACMGGRGVWL